MKVADEGIAEAEAAELAFAVQQARVTSIPLKSRGNGFQATKVIASGELDPYGLATILVHGKVKQVCRKSLFLFPIDGCFRKNILSIIEYRWFDRFILMCIVIGSILMALQERRKPESVLNKFIEVVDMIMLCFFTIECGFKIISWGFFVDRKTYLRDPWNWLDFIVVVSGWIERIPGTGDSGLGWLRLFRVLRPLRSLNAVRPMKVLVNTVISSVPRLANVSVMGAFLFVVFGIIGITLMNGIFYRRCYTTPEPILSTDGACWHWIVTDDERLCGGNYMCADSDGYCRGLEEDPSSDYAATFPGGRNGKPFCEDSAGTALKKLMPETDFVHFDHLPAALLLIFQTMTLEGWTDLMYYVMDGYSAPIAWIYFVMVVLITSFFLLNVALAVVDEARSDFDDKEEEEAAEEAEEAEAEAQKIGETNVEMTFDDHEHELQEGEDAEVPLWCDCCVTRWCAMIANDELFMNFIMVCIVANVIIMMMHPVPTAWRQVTDVLGYIILGIFIVEMIIMLLARGPKGYCLNPITAFDGFVVLSSIIELIAGSGGGLKALRTLRLFRVINKLANRISSLKVLLKAMVLTGISLKYWLVLFILVLYIFTLMYMEFFANVFHFVDTDSLDEVEGTVDGTPWCDNTEHLKWNFRQDCIPRSHFDTFPWAFVTVYQIMTGENWNTIMYAGMRAKGWPFSVLFVFLILFGQTLFLSLFLSMLMSKFDEVQDEQEEEEKRLKEIAARATNSRGSTNFSARFSSMRNALTKRSQSFAVESSNSIAACQEQGIDERLSAGTVSAPIQSFAKDGDAKALDDSGKLIESETVLPPWPKGYSLFIFSGTNPVRRCCRFVLEVDFPYTSVKFFDNFILVCILLSSLGMAIDTPLADPKNGLIRCIRFADDVFAVIFIIEMALKLVAYGFAWGPQAYLKNSWNWLDGIVVTVSIVSFITKDGPGFLKTLRILRAFRPLRVISRNENLKVVVATVFSAIPDLGTLVFVSALFLLIFALIFIMYLAGTFKQCSDADGNAAVGVSYIRDSNSSFTSPMCIADQPINATTLAALDGVFTAQRGSWHAEDKTWTMGKCADPTPVEWRRASSDTPLCWGRCDPNILAGSSGAPPTWLCPKKYTKTEQLPSVCPDPKPDRLYATEEEVGITFNSAMQRQMVLPCAGTMVDEASQKVVTPTPGVSCRDAFCPDVKKNLKDTCRKTCKRELQFCQKTCKDDADSPACDSCLTECQAACECPQFCEPVIWDAALCIEQGQSWDQRLSQDFDNIWNAMVTLFEISTTEGWVDVMYIASDADTSPYMQPVRDQYSWIWPWLFVLWIFISFMFLINLAVGVIVDKYMDLKKDGVAAFRSDAQQKWINYRSSLAARAHFYIITDLDELPPARKWVYGIISSKIFESVIMGAIVIMTICMACQIYPEPTPSWGQTLTGINYFFAAVFTVEAIVKLFALRMCYFRDAWNRFDFCCVTATIIGIVLTNLLKLEIASITSVIRIFRIARLFRLLRFLRGLNRLFMALIISLPSLANVVVIWLLLLTLFSILGVNLFCLVSTDNDTHNVHGNFRNFLWAFTTLFRASTGEAWNEIMHDLSKREVDYFRQGAWCTPYELFDWQYKYDVLDAKCLIEKPNACVQSFWGWNPLPKFYWVLFILIIAHMIMNLVITVILDGYEEGKASPEGEIIELCTEIWKKYDPNLKMRLPFHAATQFINEVLQELACGKVSVFDPFKYASHDHEDPFGVDIGSMPMRFARAWDLQLTDGAMVDIRAATHQVLRFSVLNDNYDSLAELEELDKPRKIKTSKRLFSSALSKISSRGSLQTAEEKQVPKFEPDLKMKIAGRKLLRLWREKKLRALVKEAEAKAKEEKKLKQKEEDVERGNLRQAGVVRISVEPPIAG
eukprot:TRINITY_DN9275_c0_g3_i1.p1 TRINITY_DN9275_c0_g3~~TRINITY_DN9275_c0_g3_i1.p1  ORF type:complete len:1882 (-),score=349.70 TRINITY_DN9275_c0_g3_i1:200-5845(-)